MQPYLDLMNAPDLAALRFANQIEWTFEANWKLSIDNWENYHHPWVHDGVFDRLADDIDRETRKPWSDALQQGAVLTLRRRVESAPRYHFQETGLPRIPFPEGRERITAPSFVLPNLEIAMVWDNISSIIYQPLSPQRTRAKMGFFYVGEAATADEHARGRKVTQDRWLGPSRSMEARDGVRSQDFQVFEAQQAAKTFPGCRHDRHVAGLGAERPLLSELSARLPRPLKDRARRERRARTSHTLLLYLPTALVQRSVQSGISAFE